MGEDFFPGGWGEVRNEGRTRRVSGMDQTPPLPSFRTGGVRAGGTRLRPCRLPSGPTDVGNETERRVEEGHGRER